MSKAHLFGAAVAAALSVSATASQLNDPIYRIHSTAPNSQKASLDVGQVPGRNEYWGMLLPTGTYSGQLWRIKQQSNGS
jgi:hypothetical protein